MAAARSLKRRPTTRTYASVHVRTDRPVDMYLIDSASSRHDASLSHATEDTRLGALHLACLCPHTKESAALGLLGVAQGTLTRPSDT